MATVANTSWYRKGTVGVTLNSTKVTGVGTSWLTAGIYPGATFRIDGLPYACEVAEVVSDTEIQLAQPYYGNTGSGLSYSIDRNFQSTPSARIAADLAAAVRVYEDIRDGAYLTIQGKSAYEVAVENGYTGTVAQWLESLKGAGDYAELLAKVEPHTYDNAGAHNSVYRGKNLGSAFTDEQSAAIRAGTFKDIYIGDDWKFTNIPYTYYEETTDTTAQEGKTYYADVVGTELETQPEAETDISEAGYYEKIDSTYTGTMYVANCSYRYRAGHSSINMLIWHGHIVVIPFQPMFYARMNPTNTTEGGYALSEMKTVHLKRAEAIFKACFGESHVMKHYEYMVNAVKDGKPSAGAWAYSYCDLMDERMVYGSLIYDSGATDGTNYIPRRYTTDCRQLKLFGASYSLSSWDLNYENKAYWLRNVASDAHFASVSTDGYCSVSNASSSLGVRPYAIIH